MHKCKTYLEFNKKFNAYVIADKDFEAILSKGFMPEIYLKEEDIKNLREGQPLETNAPTVGILFAREANYYSVPYSDAKSLCDAGANIKALDYQNGVMQMKDVDAVVLPGGCFDSPKEFYIDEVTDGKHSVGQRSNAYLSVIKEAEKNNLPMLGICGGAQMIGGLHNLKMYFSLKKALDTNIAHKHPSSEIAHKILINKANVFYEMFGDCIDVNSVHNEGMVVDSFKNSDLELYATCPDDNVPEAWGSEEKNILCTQYHPEVMYAKMHDKKQLQPFNWLVAKAKKCGQSRS